jgi:hypothetical protein
LGIEVYWHNEYFPQNVFLMPNFIFTADDYGVINSIDDAIIEAVNAGKINSVAAFPNGPNAVNRLKKLAKECPDVEIGCHFTITSGKPVSSLSEVKSLVRKNGKFHDFKELPHKIKASEVETELKAQLKVFEDAGITVKHLSSHHKALDFYPHIHRKFVEIANTCFPSVTPIRSPHNRPRRMQSAFIFMLGLGLE